MASAKSAGLTASVYIAKHIAIHNRIQGVMTHMINSLPRHNSFPVSLFPLLSLTSHHPHHHRHHRHQKPPQAKPS
ncbi:hypothetical protein VTJ04DRAFT_9219 [Mycothermus thermophilus]|uniref:uncharacterized protein n=1 Tax=Humicola insolens TaxID=85995 RepID=UPI0037440041